MSVRLEDNHSGWKSEAIKISGRLNTMLTPVLQEVLKNDMTCEDFFYLVNDAAFMITLKYNVDIIYKEKKEEFAKIKESEEKKKDEGK